MEEKKDNPEEEKINEDDYVSGATLLSAAIVVFGFVKAYKFFMDGYNNLGNHPIGLLVYPFAFGIAIFIFGAFILLAAIIKSTDKKTIKYKYKVKVDENDESNKNPEEDNNQKNN